MLGRPPKDQPAMNSKPPTMIFWNAQSLSAEKLNHIRILLQLDTKSHIPPLLMAFAETRFTDGNIPSAPTDYKWSCLNVPRGRNHTHSYGGLALLSHNKIPTDPLPKYTKSLPPPLTIRPESKSGDWNTAAMLWHRIRLPNTPTFILGIIYLPPHLQVNQHYTVQVTETLKTIEKDYPNTPYLVVGDFNLHHPLWNPLAPSVHKSAANALAQFLDSDDHILLNNIFIPGIPTREEANATPSVLDLAITNTSQLVSELALVHTHHLVSDHKPLTITFNTPHASIPPPQPPHESWNIHEDPDTWQAALPLAMTALLTKLTPSLQQLSQPPTNHDLAQLTMDTVYAEFETELQLVLQSTIGSRTVTHTTKRWFNNKEIQRLYKEMITVKKIINHGGAPNYHNLHSRLRHVLKYTIQEKRDEEWHTLCDMLESDDKQAQWTLLKRTTPSTYTPLAAIAHPDTKELPKTHMASINNLGHFFATSSTAVPPPCSSPHLETQLLNKHRTNVDPTSTTTLPKHVSDSWQFTTNEVKTQCTKQFTNTAPGPDKVLALFLKHGGDALYSLLSTFYTYSWQHAVLPPSWRRANVMALYKNKGSMTDPSSYRPISITSVIIRTFEHLIHKRLSPLLENKNWFHPLQFGFRPQHSTYDAINYLLTSIKVACKSVEQLPLNQPQNPPCPVIFLDLSKAFDYVWHPLLLEHIQKAGITGKAWRWINAFLTNRQIRIVDKAITSDWYPTSYGVPQGCVLSPFLFLIFINTISKKISNTCSRVSPVLYADDMALST